MASQLLLLQWHGWELCRLALTSHRQTNINNNALLCSLSLNTANRRTRVQTLVCRFESNSLALITSGAKNAN